MTPISMSSRSLARFRCQGVVILTTVASIVGCANVTRIADNQVTQPSTFDNPVGALIRRAGAYRAFVNAFASQVLYSGLLTDELGDSRGTVAVADRRDIAENNQQDGVTFPYPELSTARLDALRAIATLRQYNPLPRSRIAELYALAGYVELFFGEDMCSGVPLASMVNGRPALGPTLARSQLLQHALVDFDSATTNATDSAGNVEPMTAQLASVGRGRALIDSGDVVGAAAAVQAVPIAFVYAANYDGSAQTNAVANLMTSVVSVSDREGINGLPFVSATDPRIPIDSNVAITIGNHPLYMYRALESQTAPLALATGIEASLIRAEAKLASGDVTAWTDTLNALRQSASMAPLTTDSTLTATPALQHRVMFRERAFWLFLTGHRQGDLRRLIRATGQPIDAVFPTGPYPQGGALLYGADVTFVPFLEQGNPNFHGCLDRLP